MIITETQRLIAREFTLDDAPFILTLLNEPAWLQYIGDRGVYTLEAARDYLERGPMASYKRLGFGLYGVALKVDGAEPFPLIGMCGLIKRESLPEAYRGSVDIGFAFLAPYWGQGYATEMAAAMLDLAKNKHGLSRIYGITAVDNQSSIHVLQKLGLQFEGFIRFEPDGEELNLFGRDL